MIRGINGGSCREVGVYGLFRFDIDGNDFRSDRLKKLQNQNLKDKVTNESKIPE